MREETPANHLKSCQPRPNCRLRPHIRRDTTLNIRTTRVGARKGMASHLSASQFLSLSADESVLFVKQNLTDQTAHSTSRTSQAVMTCPRKRDAFLPKNCCEFSRPYPQQELESNVQPPPSSQAVESGHDTGTGIPNRRHRPRRAAGSNPL